MCGLCERSEIEARLKDAVEESKIRYESAKVQYQRTVNQLEDLGRTHPDGALTYRLALRDFDHARESYNKALLRFNKLILHGELSAEAVP